MKITQPSLLPGMPELEAPRTTIVREHVRTLPRRKPRPKARPARQATSPAHDAIVDCLRSFGDEGATDEQIAERYARCAQDDARVLDTADLPAQSPSALRTRRAELVRARRIVATSEKRESRSGRLARVWRTNDD